MSLKFKNILITGGAGYVGSLLVPKLLSEGYMVTVLDTCWYGNNFLPLSHPKLNLIIGDIRNLDLVDRATKNQEVVIHLACISNDSSFELDESLSTSVNLLAFEPLVQISKINGVKRFIYASSSSVYGVSDSPDVKEDHKLVPLTLYNRYKAECEPILLKYTDKNFVTCIIRPATLCGSAPRQRLDLSVNILTNHAFINEEILVFGGSQKRPNLHVKDMVRLYCDLLHVEDKLISGEIFNCSLDNLSILEIAEIVKKEVEKNYGQKNVKITLMKSNDLRSYQVNSDKIRKYLNFYPIYSVEDAIREICKDIKNNVLKDSLNNTLYFNVERMKQLGIS